MGFVPPKKFSWKPYTGSLQPVNIHLSYFALKINEESTPAFTQNHHGCLATSSLIVCLLMIFYICSLKL